MPVGLGIMFIEHFLIYLLFLMTKHDFSFNHHHILVKETSLLPCFIDVAMEVRQFRLIAPESHTVTETIQVIWLQISSSFCTFKSIFWWANGIKTKKKKRFTFRSFPFPCLLKGRLLRWAAAFVLWNHMRGEQKIELQWYGQGRAGGKELFREGKQERGWQ